MSIQFGFLYTGKFQGTQHASMEDVTASTYEAALRSAVWFARANADDAHTIVLSLFWVDMETGIQRQLLNRAEIQSIVDNIPEEDWNYFAFSRDIPVPSIPREVNHVS